MSVAKKDYKRIKTKLKKTDKINKSKIQRLSFFKSPSGDLGASTFIYSPPAIYAFHRMFFPFGGHSRSADCRLFCQS